jgi:hypothetical protein
MGDIFSEGLHSRIKFVMELHHEKMYQNEVLHSKNGNIIFIIY